MGLLDTKNMLDEAALGKAAGEALTQALQGLCDRLEAMLKGKRLVIRVELEEK